jgi:hypothetical protein
MATPAARVSGITVEVSSRVFMGFIFSSKELFAALSAVLQPKPRGNVVRDPTLAVRAF